MDTPTNAPASVAVSADPELNAIKVFADLCELLVEYGPTWYSEEVHHRAQDALHLLEEIHGLSRPARLKPSFRSLSRTGDRVAL